MKSSGISSERESVELAGDITAFISKKMVQGLGLTTTELMLARDSECYQVRWEAGQYVNLGRPFLSKTPCQMDEVFT